MLFAGRVKEQEHRFATESERAGTCGLQFREWKSRNIWFATERKRINILFATEKLKNQEEGGCYWESEKG
jgi:hypothetical protein